MPGSTEPGDLFRRVLAGFGTPAFIQRARRVEQAWADLVIAARLRRDKELDAVRRSLEAVLDRAGSWESAATLLAEPAALGVVVAAARPAPRPEQAPAARWRVRWALGDLAHAVEAFNAAWSAYLDLVDLAEVNALRDGYNRYYLIEKEAVVRNAAVAAAGFKPLPPATRADLEAELPTLPVPRLA